MALDTTMKNDVSLSLHIPEPKARRASRWISAA